METGWVVGGVMTSLVYAMNVHDPIALVWVMSTGRYVYGADRYFDGKTMHKDSIESIMIALVISVGILYARDMMIWSIPEVACSAGYPIIKEKLSLYKPVHVGLCWTCAIAIVPQLLTNSPIDVEAALSLFFVSTAMSNYADIKDIDDDKQNNIHTIPVIYGRRKALLVSTTLFGFGLGTGTGTGTRLSTLRIAKLNNNKQGAKALRPHNHNYNHLFCSAGSTGSTGSTGSWKLPVM
tara:strand:+ start:355 stop:1065 length:711 start_codon:yes stop_codon:yes gene_type:complete